MNQKKILFVVNYLPGGGLEQVLYDTVEALKSSADIQVLSIYQTNSHYLDKISCYCQVSFLDGYRHQLRGKLIKSFYSRLFDTTWFQKILFKQYLKKTQFDIVIAFAEGWSIELVANSDPKGTKKFVWIHTDFTKNESFQNNLAHYQRLLQMFDKTIFVSSNLHKAFSNYLSLRTPVIIHNGIDIDRIKRLSEEANNINIPGDRLNFVSVGRLSHEKGFDRLISSFSQLHMTQREKCHLTIIGEGQERAKLQKLINENDLNETITLQGQLKNPFPVIKACDVMLAASRYEGFGLAVLEAMALGIPIIATNTTGFSEILQFGQYGVILENADNAFDDVLRLVIDNPQYTLPYCDKASKRAEDFNIRTFQEQVRKTLVYEQYN